MTNPVHFWCTAHSDKEQAGRWIANELPCKCDECEDRAIWVLVEQQLKDNEAPASKPRIHA